MDDIVVFSPDQESYIERLDRMLHGLQQANLKIKPNKTHLFQKKVEYVWHIVDEHVIKQTLRRSRQYKEWLA